LNLRHVERLPDGCACAFRQQDELQGFIPAAVCTAILNISTGIQEARMALRASTISTVANISVRMLRSSAALVNSGSRKHCESALFASVVEVAK
jgi:hypothetical protein